MKKIREKLLHEEEEKIDLMGQESEEKAAKWVKEFAKEADKQDAEAVAKDLQVLTDKRKKPKIFSYKEQLAMMLADLLREEVFPENFHWSVEVLPKGVGMEVFTRDRQWLRKRRFAISGEPEIDFNAVTMFAYWGGDEALKEYKRRRAGKQTKSGIYLSN